MYKVLANFVVVDLLDPKIRKGKVVVEAVVRQYQRCISTTVDTTCLAEGGLNFGAMLARR